MGRKEFVMIRITTPSGVERFINNVAPTVWCYETVILSTDILSLRDKKGVRNRILSLKLTHEKTIPHIKESVKSGYFYEKDKGMTSSRKNIKLVLSYKDPVDETTAYSVSLTFEYYPRR